MSGAKTECVILAAGSSSRLGEEKALLPIFGTTLVEWISNRVCKFGIKPVIVANKRIFERVSESIANSEVIVNNHPERGRTGTLKVGIKKLDETFGEGFSLLVIPVDRPGFSDSTLERMMRASETCCPSMDGRGGHPLLLSTKDVRLVRASPDNLSLREIVDPEKFEVFDSQLHLNIDTPSDIEYLEENLTMVEDRMS